MLESVLIMSIKPLLVVFMVVNTCAVGVYLERRISAFIQMRLGPNRVGPFGVLQPLADVIKFIFKEDIIPKDANKILYNLGPFIAFAPGLIVFGVIPFGTIDWYDPSASLAVGDIGVGLLFVLAISSLTTYGLAYGGWASYSKYSVLGGLRASAQMISFEIAMGLSLISIIMTAGSVNLNEMVISQTGTIWGFLPNWLCFKQPLAFLIFFITAFAETNRLPFDMPEAEPEIVGGYHTEYSGLKFALYMLGEYAAMVTMSAVITTLFLGGWSLPFVDSLFSSSGPVVIAIVSISIFSAKTGFLIFFFMWVRWTLPRTRWDQLMKLGWHILIPLALLNIVLTAILLKV